MTQHIFPFPTPRTIPARTTDERLDAIDDRMATFDERLDLILLRGKDLLDEIVKLGRKVDAAVSENRAAAEERAAAEDHGQ